MRAPRGRPRGALKGESEEINALALLLQEQVTRSGLSVVQLRAALSPDQFPAGAIPAAATISRRLNGDGLANHWRLVEAIIVTCTPASDRARVTRKAQELNRKAAMEPTLIQPASDRSGDREILKANMSRLRSQTLAARESSTAESERRLAAERSLAQSQSLNLLLISLLKQAQTATAPVADAGARLPSLEQEVRRLAADRRDNNQLLADARLRIEQLEQRLTEPPSTPPSTPPQTGTATQRDAIALARTFRALDPDGARFADTFRQTLDSLYDGAHTGRYRLDQLFKTERTHMGTLVEINLARAFDFSSGRLLDFEYSGFEFEVMFSLRNNWVIPPEAFGRLCLLVSVDDENSAWSVGVLRATADVLSDAANRDGKKTVTAAGRSKIEWVHRQARLPVNALLQLSDEDLSVIYGHQSSQQRLNELLRRAQGKLITRTVIGTVTMQMDPLKRLRDARRQLPAEGILVLGSSDRDVADRLGLPVPGPGEFVSIRVSTIEDQTPDSFLAEGKRWAVASPQDPVVRAPSLRRGRADPQPE